MLESSVPLCPEIECNVCVNANIKVNNLLLSLKDSELFR